LRRFSYNELSSTRLLSAVLRRIADVPGAVAWSLPSRRSSANKAGLEKYRGVYPGKRCFVMGNGPSLARMDLSALEHEITFGLNRIYLLFDKIPFEPTYYVCTNELVLEQFFAEISSLAMPKFLNWNRRQLFDTAGQSTCFVRTFLGLVDQFSLDITKGVYSGGTVTYVAIQLAFFMGFSEVVLIGLDHRFSDSGTPNKTEIRSVEKDPNHFHPDYFPKGSRWQLPDLRRSEIAYQKAREVFEVRGKKILDATVGGACPVFEKADFGSLLVGNIVSKRR